MEKMLLQKVNQLCTTNREDHRRIFEALEKLKIDLAKIDLHTHEHCEDCVRHETEIHDLKTRISRSEKLTRRVAFLFLGAMVGSWFIR